MSKRKPFLIVTAVVVLAVSAAIMSAQQTPGTQTNSLRTASTYLDGRLDWWEHWPNAVRDHDTSCVSCHTALSYSLARPVLHQVLEDPQAGAGELIMLANVNRRVRMWKEVEPFYPDQTRGLPKSSESRGTESVLNAVILTSYDAAAGELSDGARQAFSNMWALQFTAGELKGAWAWLNFHYEPWESTDSAYFGAALAALAVGSAPGDYVASPEIQNQVKLLRDYLNSHADSERLFNRLMVLWASSKFPGLLTAAQRQAIVDAAISKQHEDGGWALSDLGTFKRVDDTPLDKASDGYGTGLVALALQRGGVPRTDSHVSKGLDWLAHHQDAKTGQWRASSLNKERDPASDIGKFMSDAATAYAVLALVEPH